MQTYNKIVKERCNMGRNLFDYADEKLESCSEKMSESVEKDLKEKLNEYSQKSPNDLMSELLSNVQKQKANGSFNYEQLASMVNSISSHLTPDQKNNLEQILQRIK